MNRYKSRPAYSSFSGATSYLGADWLRLPPSGVTIGLSPGALHSGLAVTISEGRTVLKEHSAMRFPRGLSVPTTWLGAIGLSCLSLACTRTPDERVAAVTALLGEAKSFQAEEYVQEEYARAEALLAEVHVELAAQRGKPWFLSSQRKLKGLLHESEVAASLVRAEAAVAVVQARQEAARHVSGAHAALDQASEAYWRAPRGRDTRADVLRMRSDLDGLLGDLTEAELALEQGEFLLAARQAADVEQRARTVAKTIDRAAAFRVSPALRASPGAPDPASKTPAPPPPAAITRPGAVARPAGRAG